MEPVRHIEHEYRVRFDEADASGRLRASGLLRYAQDMAWRHSEETGFDRAWYHEREMTWLVRNVQVSIQVPITYGDVLLVSTEVIGWRQVWARRRSNVVRVGSTSGRCEPQRMAVVRTDWCCSGPTEGRRGCRRRSRPTSRPSSSSPVTAWSCPSRRCR